MEIGTAQSIKEIATGDWHWQYFAGIALWFVPFHTNTKGKSKTAPEEVKSESNKQAKNAETKASKKVEGKFEAYEGGSKIVKREQVTEFYKKHNPFMSERQIRSHINGIDFTKPVEIIKVKEGKKLYQYTKVNTEGRVLRGDYFTDNPNATQSELGISDKYNVQTPERVYTDQVNTVDRQVITIEKNVEGVKSTSAEIKDTWSLKEQAVPTKGGGIQIYIPKNQ